MDRRTLFAIALMLVVAILPSLFFSRDTEPGAPGAEPGARIPAAEESAPPAPDQPEGGIPPTLTTPRAAAAAPIETPGDERVTVSSPLYEYVFSTHGARLAGAILKNYQTFAVGDSGLAQIVPEQSNFLVYSLAFGTDTLALGDWTFEPSQRSVEVGANGAELSWVARRGPATVRLTYTFRPDDYLFRVTGNYEGITEDPGLVLVGLGPRLRSVEADSGGDFRSYGVVTKARGTENLKFSSLDPGERSTLDGPFEWVAVKSKYFIAAILAIDEGQPRFGGALATGGARTGRTATDVHVAVSLPVPSASFSHSVYVGPQEYRRLAGIGHDLEDANPYGWILRPVIRPFAILIVRVLLWMHENLDLAYGWVLVVFGVAVRLVLWPLNQKAMRSQMAMQAVQPQMKEIQTKFKNDPQRLQQETMKLYKEHGVNPLGGCLPMLIPMPVLFALFFVFLNTIELRGVPFMWLPDLSRSDPLYIIPLVMGVSMFGVSKIGQIGVPPNPQAKMMTYVLPVMFTFLFLRFSSGLNLYYAVQNIASIPQQWLIAKQRLKRAAKQGGDRGSTQSAGTGKNKR
jgi:YidC/Oxa1 family membrane protein insertase